MSSLNVNPDAQDPFYRYKMPALETKVEGRGNGIRTIMVNLEAVSEAIYTTATTLLGFIRTEVGTQGKLKDGRYFVTGSHNAASLQAVVYTFIAKFVLCQECDNPETVLSQQTKSARLFQTCRACGSHKPLKTNHRYVTTIGRMLSQKDPAAPTTLTAAPPDKTEASPERKEGEKDDADLEWADADDTVRDSGCDALVLAMDTRLQRVCDMLKTANVGAIVREVSRLDCGSRAPMVLLDLWDPASPIKAIRAHQKLHRHLMQGNAKGQKHFLRGLMRFLLVHRGEPALQGTRLLNLLMALFDMDLVTEEIFLKWRPAKGFTSATDVAFAAEVQATVTPFITWLREAEEETDDEPDDEPEETGGANSDVDVVFDSNAASDAADSDVDIEAI